MHIMCLEKSYDVLVPYRGSETISNLIAHIQKHAPEDFIDIRLTDEHFPETRNEDRQECIQLVSFNHWWGCKEDVLARLEMGGYVPANPAELLALRAQHKRYFGQVVVALSQRWVNDRGREWVPCINSGAGYGLRLRTFDSGWAPFWKFAVKKTESR